MRQTPAMLARVALMAVLAFSLLPGCWETRRVHTSGSVEGFRVGASKRQTFEQAIANQRSGRISDLKLIGTPPTTAADMYRGNPIVPDDFDRVAEADEWHLGRPQCNCWFRLVFSEDRLRRIEEHEWTGPTE